MSGDPAWAAFLACAFLAEVIGTMAGFGAATVLTPVAVWFMDIKTAIAVVAAFHLLGNLSRLVFFGRSIDWRAWTLFGLTGIACSLLGAALATRLPSALLKGVFGAFLLIYVGVSVAVRERRLLPARAPTLVGGGILSGFIAGLIGTGGAVRSACLLAFGLPREAYLGTSAALALAVDGTRLPVYLAGGLLPSSMMPLLAALVPTAFAGAWAGQRLVRRLSPAAFRACVLLLLALMGLKLLWDAWRGGA